ncbi:uracil-DNA glycosylase [[Mycoplasma] falconis]|uniref:Uracil-DNA glycosylase n=1 Tax=[Mycoplasma] falconis TaxID=92403 RepID=A0A501XAY2_9BACT|nr:uracil-DNA glycosylase [[Mycoplasma] falconis]TPE57788.1 uracil-DNA glycosylase [[Mycoplasma] falconis]
MKFNWNDFLKEEEKKDYFKVLNNLINLPNVTPSKDLIFKAMENFNFDDLKVVIIGQDPYPNLGDADGLCFSTNAIKTPASLKNIFNEIKKDYLDTIIKSNSLNNWKNQGVLLLNSILTNEVGKTLAHKNLGWEKFNLHFLNKINQIYKNIIYVVLGKDAYNFISKLDLNNQILLSTSHPSPLGAYRGFIGSHIFKKINDELIKLNKQTINWSTY